MRYLCRSIGWLVRIGWGEASFGVELFLVGAWLSRNPLGSCSKHLAPNHDLLQGPSSLRQVTMLMAMEGEVR